MNLSRITGSVFLRDAFSLSSGTAIAQAIAIGALPILARVYTPEEFGVLAIYMVVVSFLTVFASLKLEQAIMVPESDRDAAGILVALMISSMVFSLIVLVTILLLGDNLREWTGNPVLVTWLYLLPFSLFLAGSYQGLRFWQMRKRNFKLVSIGLVNAIIASTAASILIGIWGKTLFLGAAGLIIGYVVQGVINFMVLLKGVYNNRQEFYGINREYVIESVAPHKKLMSTLILSHGIAAANSSLPAVAISGLFGNTILGSYSMAVRIVFAPAALVSNALGDVFRQRASVAWRKKGRFDSIFKKILILTSLIGVPVYAIGIVFAPEIFVFVLGGKWKVAGEYAAILLVSGMFSFITVPLDKWAIITGSFKFILRWQIMRLTLNILIIYLCWYMSFSIINFVIMLVIINIIMYLIHVANGYISSQGVN